jgi:hypothetical protein
MTSIPNIPSKIQENCSIIDLIDENQCVGNSMKVINNNFASLSTSLLQLESYASFWNNAYSTFLTNSALWLKAAPNLQKYNDQWVGAYSLINSLSANWTSSFTVHYPEIISIDSWYSNTSYYTSTVLLNWLTSNFRPSNYLSNQVITVQVSLYYQRPFTFSFGKGYYESCAPSGGMTSSCGECLAGFPSRGCNHHDDHAGFGPCDNAFDYCGRGTQELTVAVSCQGSGGRWMQVNKNVSSVDTYVARILTFKFKNLNNSWNLI